MRTDSEARVPIAKTDLLPIRSGEDVVRVRQQVRARAIEIGLGLVDQTKIITAASELARNTLDYGGGGEVRIDLVEEGGRKGVRLTFEDQGPGIPDIAQALTDHYTTGGGLGLGLGGAKRLSNEFHIESTLGVGTRITIARWKSR
ncbi:anti-sigma regulatory factor [Methylobacterium sp. BTF04]|uniref:anti-sigma regulatory factor n=1 Tax=Methylobacterium sp. BTF04 TaxID=2708300 RepID=UPI001952CB56|nr:anti-sigma regulatory factor [Methylobacterium sp. BTF04]